jgi:hypothetical protein
MLSARWIPWSLVMLGCAPNDLEVLDGGAAFDSGARTDRAVIDAPRTDGPRADAAIAMDAAPATDATASDATAPDAAATDGPRADGGPADARAACTVTPSAEPFRSPALRLHWRATAGTPFAGADQVCSTPVVADIVRGAAGEEPVPEVAFMTFSCETSYSRSVLRVVSGRAPHRLLWSQNGVGAPNDERAAYGLRWDGHPAVGDLDGNPANGLEVVAVTAGLGLAAFRSDGRLYWQSMEPLAGMSGANPSISIADLDGDGVAEVISGGAVVNGRTGAVRWQAATRGSNGQGPLSVVIDLDGDGSLEVITGSAVYDASGGRASGWGRARASRRWATCWTGAATRGPTAFRRWR